MSATAITWLAGQMARDDDGWLHGERRLWLAVIGEALVRDKPAALRRWLASPDGREVCALAGLEPEWVSDFIVGRVPRLRADRVERGADRAA